MQLEDEVEQKNKEIRKLKNTINDKDTELILL